MNLLLEIPVSGNEAAGGILAFLAAMFLVSLIVGIILYVYMSLAYMAMGKKAKDELAGLAWIPGVGPAIVAFRASKMHWWPWLLIIGVFIPIVGILAALALVVFVVIWNWKLLETIGKPGWWAILFLIPIVNLIMVGIAAWSD